MFMSSATMGARLFSTIALIFLARLLDPRDFGVVALAMVLFSTARLFSGLGMAQALIQSRRPDSQTAFWAFITTCVFGGIIFGLVNLLPVQFAALLGEPDLIPVIRWLSLLMLADVLVLVPEALLRKELQFGYVSSAILAGQLVDNAVAVAAAFAGLGLWSLVIGKLAGSCLRLLIIWIAAPARLWLKPTPWDATTMRELWGYGIKSTASGFTNFFNSHWDDWLVGRVLGTTALGFYDKAYSITNGTIAGLSRSVIDAVLFPSYSKIQHDPNRLANAFIRGLTVSALFMAPLAMGVLAIAYELVPTLLGDKWIPMIPALQIFAFMALARPLASSTSPLFRALNKPEYDMRAGLVVLIIMAPMALGLLNTGIVGVAFAVTFSYVCGFGFNVYQVHRLLPQAARRMVPAILPAIVCSAIMIGAIYLTRQVVANAGVNGSNSTWRDGECCCSPKPVPGWVFSDCGAALLTWSGWR